MDIREEPSGVVDHVVAIILLLNEGRHPRSSEPWSQLGNRLEPFNILRSGMGTENLDKTQNESLGAIASTKT